MLCSHQTEDFKGLKVFHCPWQICFTFQSFPIWNIFSFFLKKIHQFQMKKMPPQFHRVVCSSIITLMTTSKHHFIGVLNGKQVSQVWVRVWRKDLSYFVFNVTSLKDHLPVFSFTFVYKTLKTTESSHEYLHFRGLIQWGIKLAQKFTGVRILQNQVFDE